MLKSDRHIVCIDPYNEWEGWASDDVKAFADDLGDDDEQFKVEWIEDFHSILYDELKEEYPNAQIVIASESEWGSLAAAQNWKGCRYNVKYIRKEHPAEDSAAEYANGLISRWKVAVVQNGQR